MKFSEDDFDLKLFNEETIKTKRQMFRKKYEKLINFLIFLIVVLMFVIAISAYDIINHSIESYKIKKRLEESFSQNSISQNFYAEQYQ